MSGIEYPIHKQRESALGGTMSIESVSSKDNMDLPLEELRKRLTDCHAHCAELELQNSNNQQQINLLEHDAEEKQAKIKLIEADRETLRNTVKKASESWFQRKARLSEGESEDDQRLSDESTTKNDSKTVNATPQASDTFSSRADDPFRIMFDLKFKTEQLEMSERRCEELHKRLHDYEKVIDDQEVIVHGLKEQLDTYYTDNQNMSQHLAGLVKLFQELEAANNHEVTDPEEMEKSLETLDNLPTRDEFSSMSKSVSKTYITLKELIYEKKSLVTEIERLKTLNVELQMRVSQQENRLVNVSDALQTTWLIVSNLKEDHARIHTTESILRYELKDKRDILTKLREELEWAREQWHTIRKINTESEEQWKSLRSDLDDRKEKQRTQSEGSEHVDVSELGACANLHREASFEPPVDLLLDMGIEYGVVDADDEEAATVVALIDGESVDSDRLQDLEDQCSHLYQKLMSSTSRALALASRLTTLHQHYSASDDEEDDEEDEEYEYIEIEDNLFDTDLVSADSEGYDTAYVSETDGADANSAIGGPGTGLTASVEQMGDVLSEAIGDDHAFEISPECEDDGCDVLSRRLITFLPKKIEILKIENKKLEDKIQALQEDKTKSEIALKSSIEFEIRHRKQLEEQLSHLGKCVDELKLERNGKIAKVEAELQKKMKEVQQEQEEHQQVVDDLENVKEKLEQQMNLLSVSVMENAQSEGRATKAEEALIMFKVDLDLLRTELEEVREINSRAKMDASSSGSLATQSPHTVKYIEDCTLDARILIMNVAEPPMISAHSTPCLTVHSDLRSKDEQTVSLDSGFTLNLPCYIDSRLTLFWSLQISEEELPFKITFSALPSGDGCEAELEGAMWVSSPIDLMSPLRIKSSDLPTKGKLSPRLPGKYSLVLVNDSSRSQDIRFKVWTEPRHQDGDEDQTHTIGASNLSSV